MKVCDRQKGEILTGVGILQYLHPKARKSNLELPHKNVKVCLFHKEGMSNIKSSGTTFIFDEKSPVASAPAGRQVKGLF